MIATESEAHREWHLNSGQEHGCPWDCCQPPEPDWCEWCEQYVYDDDGPHPCFAAWSAGYKAGLEAAHREPDPWSAAAAATGDDEPPF